MGGCLLILFIFLEPFLFSLKSVGPSACSTSWILYSALASKRFIAFFILAVVAACFFKQRPADGGERCDRAWKILLSTAVVVLTIGYSAYDYNFYWDQWHILDRIGFLILCAATLWNLAFLPLWVLQFSVIVGQFAYTPLTYSWTDKLPVIQLCYLGALYVPMWMIFRPARKHLSGIFLAAAMIMWGGFYLSTGLAKIRFDWLWQDPTQNLMIGAWLQNNWLGFLDEEHILKLASVVDYTDWILRLFVVIVELGACIFLFHRRLCIGFVASFFAMHLGIFALTGIFFWKWMAIDLGVLYIVSIVKPFDLNVRSGIIGLAFMFAFVLISKRDIPLGWLDAPMASRFEFRAVTDSGERIEVPPSRFEPYDMPFGQGRFYFTTERRQLIDCMGSIDSTAVHESIVAAAGKHEIEEVILEHGREVYSSQRSKQLAEFLRQYARYLESGRTPAYRFLGLPQHIWSFTDTPLETAEGKHIVAWEIEHTEWLYNKGSIDEIYNHVYQIPIANETPR